MVVQEEKPYSHCPIHNDLLVNCGCKLLVMDLES